MIKDAAFALLGDMLDVLDRYPTQDNIEGLADTVDHLLDTRLEPLIDRMTDTVALLHPQLPAAERRLLDIEFVRWRARTGWQLINIADPCGT